uniref:NH(3)-dependent NAD(+) synthetase n=1 Tax=Syphacia muris TaxID=451379 RepID=A0A0N5AG18_9BILA
MLRDQLANWPPLSEGKNPIPTINKIEDILLRLDSVGVDVYDLEGIIRRKLPKEVLKEIYESEGLRFGMSKQCVK